MHRSEARPDEILVAVNLLLHRVALELLRQRLCHRVHELFQPAEEHGVCALTCRELGEQRVRRHLHVVVVPEAGD